MRYTEHVHAKRLVRMLERNSPCDCCPAQPHYATGKHFLSYVRSNGNFTSPSDACIICKRFVGINPYSHGCPCTKLGKKKALEKTQKILKEKGYL